MAVAFPGPGSGTESTTAFRSGSMTVSQLGPATQGSGPAQSGFRFASATKTFPLVTATAVGVCPGPARRRLPRRHARGVPGAKIERGGAIDERIRDVGDGVADERRSGGAGRGGERSEERR